MTDQRAAILVEAAAEIGAPGHARIMQYHRSAYGRDVGDREQEWCGLFCLAMLHQAGVALSVFWRNGGGFCEEQKLPKVRPPEPGDIAYYANPFHHHALVELVVGDTVYTIDGNQRNDTVKRVQRPLRQATFYYSIAPFLHRQTSDTDPAPPPVHPVLRLGSSGADVAMMQSMLNRYQGSGLTVDGAFGPRTARALQTFQRDRGLDADGVCGPKTWAELERVQ